MTPADDSREDLRRDALDLIRQAVAWDYTPTGLRRLVTLAEDVGCVDADIRRALGGAPRDLAARPDRR